MKSAATGLGPPKGPVAGEKPSAAAPSPAASFSERLEPALPWMVLAATLLVYAGTLGFSFVGDDQGQIVQNLFVQSWRYAPRYFTSHVWSYLLPGAVGNYYRPIFLLWLRANDAVFGLEPAGWHLTSVLAHLTVTLEVYWLGLRLLEDRLAATIASAIFGLHPIHVEAVAWVSGATEPLVAGLMLGSFLAYLRFRERIPRSALWFAASLALYAGATLTKETALVTPMLIFAFEWIWRRDEGLSSTWGGKVERFRAAFKPAIPYLAVTALYLPVRILALGGFSHILTPLPTTTIILTTPSLIWFYLKKLVWPSGLSLFYDLPYVTRPGIRDFFLPTAVVGLIAGLLWVWSRRGAGAGNPPESRRESRVTTFSLVWLALPILPILNVSVLGSGDMAHDRYLYLPSMGAAWLVAAGWHHMRVTATSLGRRRVLEIAVPLSLAILLGAVTVGASAYWSDNLSLYTRGTSVAPHSFRAQLCLADAACDRGYYEAGMKLYAQVIEEDPNFSLAYYDRGVTELELGRLEAADRDLTRAIELNVSDPSAFYSLGLVRSLEGHLGEAVSLLRRALELQPEGVGYHLALGQVLEKSGDLQAALAEFQAEYSAHPEIDQARREIVRLQRLNGLAGSAGKPEAAKRNRLIRVR